jgi:uncharacterized protein YggT (Ycf19 family)
MKNHDQNALRVKLTHIIWGVFSLIEGLIGLRILLKLFVSTPESPFASFIYTITEPFLRSFQSSVVQPSAGGIFLELSSLIAMIVYALLAWALAKVLSILLYRSQSFTPRSRR